MNMKPLFLNIHMQHMTALLDSNNLCIDQFCNFSNILQCIYYIQGKRLPLLLKYISFLISSSPTHEKELN